MKNKGQPSENMPTASIFALMLAVFTVSVGYGIVLPLLPYLIERLIGGTVITAQVSRHTGLLTGAYALALFLFAPMWGQLSDRIGRRNILLVGLLGFSITMLISSFVESLVAVYAERILSGIFSAAVTPVAAAAIGDIDSADQLRARRLAFVSMAGIAGFLLGPMLSVFISRFSITVFTIVQPSGSLKIPLLATSFLAIIIAIAVTYVIPNVPSHERLKTASTGLKNMNTTVVLKLLALTFIVSAGIGVFEVGLALRGKQDIGLTPYQIALMFSACSLVMFVAQGIVFSSWIKPEITRWFIPPALAILAFALFFVPRASNFSLMLAVVGTVAASAGILSPILTYWISSRAGSAQGWELGKQTAAASLGVTIGSAAGGLLFKVGAFSGASFILAAALTGLGFLLSFRLPYLLMPHNL